MGDVSVKKQRVLLMIMILLQVGVMLYFGDRKAGFHMDEYATYTLANGYCDVGLPAGFTDFEKYLSDALAIQKDEIWDYRMVWENQAADVHPPLYYAGFHALSSLFIGSASKWIGIGYNLIFFILNILLLYKLSRRIFDEFYPAMAVCLLYGFSAGAVSNVMFIRMYEMYTCAVLLVLNWHVKYYDMGRIPWYAYAALTVMTVGGILTHYYFLIYLCFLSIIFMLYKLYRHEVKNWLKYAVSMGAAGGIAYLMFPAMSHQIFSGYRGREAFANIRKGADFWQRFYGALKWCVNPLAGGCYVLLFIVIATAVIGVFSILKRKCRISIHLPWMMTVVPALIYVGIVSKIAPLTTDRYYYPIYICFCIFITGCVYYIFKQIAASRITVTLTLLAVFLLVLLSHRKAGVQNLFIDRASYGKIVESYYDEDCIYVYSQGSWTVWENISALKNFKYIDFINYDEQDSVYDLAGNKDDFILMLPCEMDYEKITDSLNRNYVELGRTPTHVIYSVIQ